MKSEYQKRVPRQVNLPGTLFDILFHLGTEQRPDGCFFDTSAKDQNDALIGDIIENIRDIDKSGMGLYSQVKEQVSTRDVAVHYGHKVNRKGMMRCPFHPDKTPSMKVDKNFICFGCQEKGDVIRFASKLFGLPPYDAAGKLIEDMGLTVTAENRPEVQPGIRQKAKRERTEKQLFDQAVDRIYDVYCDYYRLLNEWAGAYAPV